jgi:GNAT superfamily N-acetyltransferase
VARAGFKEDLEQMIRRCRYEEFDAILAIINRAAERYRGVIPADRWHEPYMPAGELNAQISAGVEFWGKDEDGELIGIMGIQRVADVVLIRHAYVAPVAQGKGVGGALLEHLRATAHRPILIGTWADASWAIAFYQRHGFKLVPPEDVRALLRTYWDIPERQAELSVVLTDTPINMLAAS